MQAEEQFLAIGLDKKRAADTVKNAKLTADLLSAIEGAGLAGQRCDKAVGNLLYALATELPAQAAPHRASLAQLIGAGRITSKQQLTAAFKFAADCRGPTLDVAALEAACGVGVVVSRAEIAAAVARALATLRSDATTGEVMRVLKGDAALRWADQSEVRSVLSELRPEPAKAPKQAKSPAAAASAAEAAAKPQKSDAAAEPLPTLVEDASLPAATAVRICDAAKHSGERVRVHGWVAHAREARKGLVFVELRDGSGCVQCVIAGAARLAHPALVEQSGLLVRETSLELTGTLQPFPAGQHAPKTEARTVELELHADWWTVIGRSDPDIETTVTAESDVPRRLDYRHLVLRGPTGFTMLRVRGAAMFAFRQWFDVRDFVEVTPPTLVQTFCEGGSDLFKLDYYGAPAYLTQSSQLYLETVLPAIGNTFCVLPSFRAEMSRTPRHLSEYTHLEAELPFITFEDLLGHLEDLVCDVCKAIMDKCGDLILHQNPKFVLPQKPFMRLSYRDAIKFCQEHDILNSETGKPFVYGEDITEKPERTMTNMIGKPVLMIRFPAKMKAFYMRRCADDPEETESVDVLMPGVGEIVGGSMRIHDREELMAAYKRVGIDPSPYYWFTDQRKYGTVPHGGYGLGVERFLMWMLGEDHIRNLCLYPRYLGRCQP